MPTLVNRVLKILRIGAIAGAAVGVVRAIRGSAQPAVTGQASWPPLAADDQRPPRTGPVKFAETAPATEPVTEADTDQTWVEPIDGECPATHPIKGNAGSMIFHVPGGMSYDRTIPERCYANETDAEADGFRRSKR